MRYLANLIIALAMILVLGCGEDKSTQPTSASYRYEDFVHFDTAAVAIDVIFSTVYKTEWSEPVLDWEEGMGEPFFDLNNNGIYEPGIDSFVMALDPAINQDLDRNNMYTPGGDWWTPGLPFDDINGDGVRSIASGTYSNVVPGLPFCDINGNGQRDSAVGFYYCLSKWWEQNPVASLLRYRRVWCPSTFRYVSDSGFVYEIPTRNGHFSAEVYADSAGLFFYRDTYNFDTSHVMIFGKEGMSMVSNEIIPSDMNTMPMGGDHCILHKTVECGVSRIIDSREMTDLIVATYIADYGELYDPRLRLQYREYVFSRERGLFGYGFGELVPIDNDTIRVIWYGYFLDPVEVNDSLIFDMTF